MAFRLPVTLRTAARSLATSSRCTTSASAVSHAQVGVRDASDGDPGLRMLVFGKPGSGKVGTVQSKSLASKFKPSPEFWALHGAVLTPGHAERATYDIAFVSTGDVLRKEIAAKSDVGRKAEEVVASGGLVSDELMLEIVKTELDRLKGRSWIMDGFPRTLHQGELLDSVLNTEGRPLNMIVHLNVPDAIIMKRISARWVHLPSGRVYNDTYSAPRVPGKDDVTGEPLSKRPDDTPETFSKRLQAYYESTAPLLEYFSSAYPDSLHSLSGSSSDEVLLALQLCKRPLIYPPPSDNPHSLEQLWPQLQQLVEPYGIRRRDHELEREEAGKVREKADDLRDPQDDVAKK